MLSIGERACCAAGTSCSLVCRGLVGVVHYVQVSSFWRAKCDPADKLLLLALHVMDVGSRLQLVALLQLFFLLAVLLLNEW